MRVAECFYRYIIGDHVFPTDLTPLKIEENPSHSFPVNSMLGLYKKGLSACFGEGENFNSIRASVSTFLTAMSELQKDNDTVYKDTSGNTWTTIDTVKSRVLVMATFTDEREHTYKLQATYLKPIGNNIIESVTVSSILDGRSIRFDKETKIIAAGQFSSTLPQYTVTHTNRAGMETKISYVGHW